MPSCLFQPVLLTHRLTRHIIIICLRSCWSSFLMPFMSPTIETWTPAPPLEVRSGIANAEVSSPLIRLCSCPTDAQLELDHIKVSLSFWRLWIKCHICWMPDVETTARHWAHARGTLDPFLQTIFSFDHAGFGATSKGHIHSVEALSSQQRSPSCLSAQGALLFSLSLSAVSHSHSKPENSTF